MTLRASDGTESSALDVAVTVGNADEAGALSLSSMQPQAGEPFVATLTDPDIVDSAVTWEWERSTNRVSWDTIVGATSDRYAPADDDIGRFLRATASYADRHGSNKQAEATSSNTVRAVPITNRHPEFSGGSTQTRSIDEDTSVNTRVERAVSVTLPQAVNQICSAPTLE